MKSVLLWILTYLGVPAGFMLATGFPQFLYNTKSGEGTSPGFTTEELATLKITPDNCNIYLDTLIESRRVMAKHDTYSAWLYFSDLNQISMYKQKYKINYQHQTDLTEVD